MKSKLWDTTSRSAETCWTQPATGRKPAGHNLPLGGNLPDTTSHRKETAGHNQPPEGNLPDTTIHRKETAGHNQLTPQCLHHLLLHGQSHLFRGTASTGDRKSTELQHPHTVNEMAGVHIRYLSSEAVAPVGVLFWACRSEGK